MGCKLFLQLHHDEVQSCWLCVSYDNTKFARDVIDLRERAITQTFVRSDFFLIHLRGSVSRQPHANVHSKNEAKFNITETIMDANGQNLILSSDSLAKKGLGPSW